MKSVFSRREVLPIIGLGVAAPLFLHPRWSAAAVTEKSDGFARLRLAGSEARLLATTDLHFFAKALRDNPRTLREFRRLVGNFRPDLMVLNGDVWYNNPRGLGERHCAWVCEQMGALGVPWAFVRGNHDLADVFSACERRLTEAPNSLYAGEGSNSNYRVGLLDAQGRVGWRILIINDTAPELGFRQAQIEWLRAETARIRRGPEPEAPALLFCHVPVAALADLVRQGAARGIMKEKVSFEGGSTEALAAIRESGIVRAVFCGHDHLNNFRGKLDGVHLEYLRATGFGGYGNLRLHKGATIITLPLDPAGRDFQVRTVFADGTEEALEQKPKLITR